MKVVTKEDDVAWNPHPIAKGVEIKVLLSKKDHGADVTCMLVRAKKGFEVPEHVHKEQDDILYPLTGRGKMWVDGIGEFDVGKGMIIRVPKNTKHKVRFEEDTLLYDVFSPATM